MTHDEETLDVLREDPDEGFKGSLVKTADDLRDALQEEAEGVGRLLVLELVEDLEIELEDL